MFTDWACHGGGGVSLSAFVVALRNAQEARRRAVAPAPFVSVAAGAVEVMKGVLMGSSTFTADNKVFVSSASVDCMTKAEASGALRQERAGFPTADGY